MSLISNTTLILFFANFIKATAPSIGGIDMTIKSVLFPLEKFTHLMSNNKII